MKTCSKCGSKNLIKKGFTPVGKQRYKCKDCGYYSTMIQKLTYDRADYSKICEVEELSKECIQESNKDNERIIEPVKKSIDEKSHIDDKSKLSIEETKIIYIYKFRFNVSEEDIAEHLGKPIELIKNYVKFCQEQQEKTKNCINFNYKEKQLKHWLGIK